MSKQVRVEAFCDDPFNSHPDTVEPCDKERVIGFDASGPLLADCCDPCAKMVDDLRDVLLERCVRVAWPKKQQRRKQVQPEPGNQPMYEPGVCPEPGCGHPEQDRNLLRGHVKRVHGKGFVDYPGFSLRKGRARREEGT